MASVVANAHYADSWGLKRMDCHTYFEASLLYRLTSRPA